MRESPFNRPSRSLLWTRTGNSLWRSTALNLASALFTWRFVHIAELEAALPLEVTHGSRTLMAFAGLLLILLGFPVAVVGVLAWWVPYRLCGVVANRVPGAAEQRDQIALYKLVAGAILFPLFLAFETAAVWGVAGAPWAALAFVFLPFAGISSLFFFEYASWRESQARELLALVFMPGGIARLRARRDALVAECDRLAGVFRRASDNPAR